MKKQSFKAVAHPNIFGKVTKYVILQQEGEEDVVIQVGEQNYEKVKAMTEKKVGEGPLQGSYPLKEIPKENGKKEEVPNKGK